MTHAHLDGRHGLDNHRDSWESFRNERQMDVLSGRASKDSISSYDYDKLKERRQFTSGTANETVSPLDFVGPGAGVALVRGAAAGGRVAVSGIISGVGSSEAAIGTTQLFRAVGPAELADIIATGTLRNLGSAEGKYFTTSAAEAAAYAKQAVKAFGDSPYTIIRTDVPNSIFKGLSPATVDRGIPAWVIPTDRLPGLTPNVLNYSPLPPVRF